MPHFPKPFFVKVRSVWYVQINGKQHSLGPDKDRAFRRYHDLMNRPAPIASEFLAGIIDAYLEWCQKHRSPRTYEWYTNHLEAFVNSLIEPAEMRVEDLKPFHIHGWVDQHPTWGPSHRRGAISAVQRAFSWAEKMGHIPQSPVRHVEKPESGRRDQIISPAEYDRILTVARDQAFHDLVVFSWESGARPQETRTIEARHFQREHQRIEIPPKEAKGKKRWRIIHLNETALAIIRRLVLKHPSGPLFRNTDGKPWHPYAINCRFNRMKAKFGVKYALYSFRHTFANRMLTAGIDSLTVSVLLGHADGTMLARVYSHLNQSRDFLQEELRKASARSA